MVLPTVGFMNWSSGNDGNSMLRTVPSPLLNLSPVFSLFLWRSRRCLVSTLFQVGKPDQKAPEKPHLGGMLFGSTVFREFVVSTRYTVRGQTGPENSHRSASERYVRACMRHREREQNENAGVWYDKGSHTSLHHTKERV